MKAEYTVKIGGVFYEAGEEIPDTNEVKAVSTPKEVEPPISESKPEQERPAKRQYTRRK